MVMKMSRTSRIPEIGAASLKDSAHSLERHTVVERSPKRMIRRTELRKIVPLANTTIYELEQRGEFPRRFNLTTRCVVWDLAEVEAWIEERRRASEATGFKRCLSPNVRLRRTRPMHS